ncbi:MAG: hypothetical protein IJS62_05680 [Bacteroidales bacterium]|nr:hypothetical protein [Bacteroidales bacterium]
MFAVVSCNKETAGDGQISDLLDSGFSIAGYASGDEDSRMAVENGDGHGYPCVWNAGDKIAIRTAAGKTVATGTLNSGAGERFATFSLAAGTVTPSEGETVRVVYPNTRGMTFSNNTLPSSQVQAGAGNPNNNISANAFACADITYSTSGFPSKFTLRHLLSYVHLSLSSEAFSGVTLNSVTLSCSGAALSGTYKTDYTSLAVTPLSGVDHVTVSFTDPLILNGARKDIWFTVLPVNLNGKTVTLTYSLTTPDETFEVSEALPGIALEQGKAYTIDRTGFDPVPGFCPIDTRIRTGEGHSYGQANTFLIQCKDGSTYTGGTYKENPDIPSSVTIDYRVRGDRATAVIPDNVSFGWATTAYGITQNAAQAYLPRWNDYPNSNVDPSGFSFSVDESNYTVTVTNNSAHAGAPILLMMKDGKILWGWSFWNIAADGTELKVEEIGAANYQLANLEIGCPTVNYAQWAANKASNGTNPDPIWRMIHKYQWGRFLPVFWTSYWSLRIAGNATYGAAGNVPACAGPVSMAKSLEYPYGLIVPEPAAVNAEISDWLSTGNGGLWGNCSAEQLSMGKKTIYDPCPAGWRVPDFYNLQSRRYAETWSVVTTAGYYGWKGSKSLVNGSQVGTYFPASGAILNKIGNLSGTEARIANAGGNTNGVSAGGGWWTNYTKGDEYKPAAFGAVATGSTPADTPGWYDSTTAAANPTKAHGFAVRCMPDKDER